MDDAYRCPLHDLPDGGRIPCMYLATGGVEWVQNYDTYVIHGTLCMEKDYRKSENLAFSRKGHALQAHNLSDKKN